MISRLLLIASLMLATAHMAEAAQPHYATINVQEYGARGDCSTDDSKAIAAAENVAMALPAGSIPTIYFPAACYAIGSDASLPLLTHPMHIKGDGTHKTYINVLPSYIGDIFSFSEVWQGGSYINGVKPTADNAGVMVTGISIFGDKTSPNVNNALAFYDRDNFAIVRDFEAFYLNGSCLFTGHNKNQNRSYVRESLFYNLRCNNTGTPTTAAVDLSSTTVAGDDATNELQFFGLNIFNSAGVGLDIRNPDNYSATRGITFFGVRVEFSAGDNIQIGSASDAGQVLAIKMFGMESVTPGQTNSGHFGVNIDTSGPQMYEILIEGGGIGPCWGGTTCFGINMGNMRLSRVQLNNIATSGANVTYTPTIGSYVTLDGNGLEKTWTYNFGTGAQSRVRMPAYQCGDPTGTRTPC